MHVVALMLSPPYRGELQIGWASGSAEMATSTTSRRRTRRSFSVLTVPDRSLADQAIGLVAPWSIHQYPGKRQALAQMIGVKVSTARTYLRGEAQLPAYHAER